MLRACGPAVEQGICIGRYNPEMRELYKYSHIVAGIKNKRFEYIGYVVIMGLGRRF